MCPAPDASGRSARPIGLSVIVAARIGNHRLAGNGHLASRYQRSDVVGQVDIDARSKANHTDPLPDANVLALMRKGHDAARDEAGDLHHGDAPGRPGDDERVTFILLARFIEVRVEKLPGPVDDALDAARHGTAINVTVEHAHENRDSRPRLVTEAE